MLTHVIKNTKSAVGKRFRSFGLVVSANPPSLGRANQLIFLCGANRSKGVPSERRAHIKRFIEKLSPDYRVIYAEQVFNELTKIGGHNTQNVLDLEHQISDIADRILIVLESPSAFCELGAFAHRTLRQKLIVINNSHYKSEESFINAGPIAAATEAKAPVMWYPMTPDGIHVVDGIGTIFSALKDSIHGHSGGGTVPREPSTLTASKYSLYFVHDLVLILGPVSHNELVEALVTAFGDKNYDMLKRLLGILRAAELIRSYYAGGTWVYLSTSNRPFLHYHFNLNPMIAAFRTLHLKNYPARFSHA